MGNAAELRGSLFVLPAPSQPKNQDGVPLQSPCQTLAAQNPLSGLWEEGQPCPKAENHAPGPLAGSALAGEKRPGAGLPLLRPVEAVLAFGEPQRFPLSDFHVGANTDGGDAQGRRPLSAQSSGRVAAGQPRSLRAGMSLL